MSVPKITVEIKSISKPRRMWLIFKPKEIVEGEKFDLMIKFTHLEGDFHGGTFRLIKVIPGNITQFHSSIEVPSLKNKESKTVMIEDVVMNTSGHCGFYFHNQRTQIREKIQDYNFLYIFTSFTLESYFLIRCKNMVRSINYIIYIVVNNIENVILYIATH